MSHVEKAVFLAEQFGNPTYFHEINFIHALPFFNKLDNIRDKYNPDDEIELFFYSILLQFLIEYTESIFSNKQN